MADVPGHCLDDAFWPRSMTAGSKPSAHELRHLCLQVILVVQSSQLLIKVKRKELRYKARQQRAQGSPAAGSSAKKAS